MEELACFQPSPTFSPTSEDRVEVCYPPPLPALDWRHFYRTFRFTIQAAAALDIFSFHFNNVSLILIVPLIPFCIQSFSERFHCRWPLNLISYLIPQHASDHCLVPYSKFTKFMKISGKNAVCEGVLPFKCRGGSRWREFGHGSIPKFFSWRFPPPQGKKKKKNRKTKNKKTKPQNLVLETSQR